MIWARASCGLDDQDTIQEQVETLFSKLGCPRQMMLLATVETGNSEATLFLSLPSPSLLRAFEGFEQIGPNELPATASLLVGRNDEFRRRFGHQGRSP